MNFLFAVFSTIELKKLMAQILVIKSQIPEPQSSCSIIQVRSHMTSLTQEHAPVSSLTYGILERHFQRHSALNANKTVLVLFQRTSIEVNSELEQAAHFKSKKITQSVSHSHSVIKGTHSKSKLLILTM